MKIFDLYDMTDVKVTDEGLKKYVNVEGKLVLKSHGRNRERFGRSKVNIVERLAGMLGVPGHRGKKHKIQTKHASGKYNKNMKTVLSAFKIVFEKTKENPVQVFIKAVENSAPNDEITTIEYGGARYPQSVDSSPTRRISLALRNLVHGAYDKAFADKRTIADGLAEEIIMASQNDNNSFAVSKRTELEKQADSAR